MNYFLSCVLYCIFCCLRIRRARSLHVYTQPPLPADSLCKRVQVHTFAVRHGDKAPGEAHARPPVCLPGSRTLTRASRVAPANAKAGFVTLKDKTET